MSLAGRMALVVTVVIALLPLTSFSDEAAVETLIKENKYAEALASLSALPDSLSATSSKPSGGGEKAVPLKRFLETAMSLRKAVADGVAAGAKVAFADRVLGQPMRGAIITVDNTGIEIDYGVTKERKPWEEITPRRLIGLARTAKPDDGAVAAASYLVATASGETETADELLTVIKEKFPTLLPETEKPASMTFSAPPAAKPEAPTDTKPAEVPQVVVVKPEEDTDRVLKLPDCGWLSRTNNPYRPNYLEAANIVYDREEWKDWEPNGGQALRLAKSWLDGKRYFAFRVMANTHAALPERLKTVIPQVKKKDGKIIPAYWDQSFIDEHKKLVEYIASQVGQNPYLCYVDIGAVGDTGGEWVLYGDWIEMGLTSDKANNLVWSFTKMYREAFPPYVRLYLATAAFQYAQNKSDLVDYCKKNNIGRRLDGLGGDTTKAGFWAKSYKSYWKDTPYQWEGAFTTFEWEKDGPYTTPAVLEAGLEYGPSIMTYADNHVQGEDFAKTKADLLKKYGVRLGYRYVIKEAAYPGSVKAGGRYNLLMVMTNKGCTKCYADRDMEVTILDTNGAPVAEMRSKPTPGSSEWMPGEEKQVALPFQVPNLGSGTYVIAVALLDDHPLRPNNRLEMGMKNKTKDNRYVLGAISVR